MLSEVANMARISYLLCLVLIVMSVSASARRPPVVEDNQASIPLPSPLSYGGSGKTKPGDFASLTDVSRRNNKASDPMSPGIDGKRKIGRDEKENSLVKGMINEKTEGGDGNGNGKLKQDIARPVNMAIGLIPVVAGGDGSFHFNLGPIDFGGNIGWGGGYAPGYVYSQPQPYVIVSPYTSPYPKPSPFAPPITGPGQDQPSPGSSGFNPSARGSGLGSSQIGGSAAYQHN